jgi:BirA family biotin operon repressor/biotin-[acetyl-CoA-carboxylase] ligase
MTPDTDNHQQSKPPWGPASKLTSRTVEVLSDHPGTLASHLGVPATTSGAAEPSAGGCVPRGALLPTTDAPGLPSELRRRLFETTPASRQLLACDMRHLGPLVLVSQPSRSQFDVLAEALREHLDVPDGLVCIGAQSTAFRGHHGRSWVALEGNLHLTVALRPKRPIEHFGPGLLALGALAAVDAVDELTQDASLAGIHWVNDVVVRGCKLAGILAWSQLQGGRVDALLLGIGLNVLARPIGVADQAVAGALCLKDLVPEVTLAQATSSLVRALDRRIGTLLTAGGQPLVADYRRRLTLLGRRVRHVSDRSPQGEPPAEGIVSALGEGLELWLQGQAAPLLEGRVALLE